MNWKWECNRAIFSGKGFDEYLADELLRSAVKRQFEIFGEAHAHLIKADPKLAEQLRDAGNVMGFRSVLINGYAKVNSAIVWQAATQSLPKLLPACRCAAERTRGVKVY